VRYLVAWVATVGASFLVAGMIAGQVSLLVGAVGLLLVSPLVVVFLVREYRRICALLRSGDRFGLSSLTWLWVGRVGTTVLGCGFVLMLDTDRLYLGGALTVVGVAMFVAFLIRELRWTQRHLRAAEALASQLRVMDRDRPPSAGG